MLKTVVLLALATLLTGCGGTTASNTSSSAGSSGNGSNGGTSPAAPSVANEWTWEGGSNTVPSGAVGQSGVYGTEGVAATTNSPGGRQNSVSGIDSVGNLWLFGGFGFDSAGTYGDLNDLWEFNPNANTWTWVSGSETANAVGVFGTEGTAAAVNVPGSRYSAVGWIDSSNNLWLFGGLFENTSTGANDFLNDLWEFNSSAKTWTWVSGSNAPNAVGVYGTLGVAAGSNVPGARWNAVSWIDGTGNLWLFGGGYIGTTGSVDLNDLWRYQP